MRTIHFQIRMLDTLLFDYDFERFNFKQQWWWEKSNRRRSWGLSEVLYEECFQLASKMLSDEWSTQIHTCLHSIVFCVRISSRSVCVYCIACYCGVDDEHNRSISRNRIVNCDGPHQLSTIRFWFFCVEHAVIPAVCVFVWVTAMTRIYGVVHSQPISIYRRSPHGACKSE